MGDTVILKKLQPGTGIREVDLPVGTEVLGVTLQGHEVCVICRTDPSEPERERYLFQQVLNGEPIADSGGMYVGTVQIEEELKGIPQGMIVPAGVDPSKLRATQVMWVHVFLLEVSTDEDEDSLDAAGGGSKLLPEGSSGTDGGTGDVPAPAGDLPR